MSRRMGLAGATYEAFEEVADFSAATGLTIRSGHLDRKARKVVAAPKHMLGNLAQGTLVRVNDTYSASAGNFLVFGKETLDLGAITLIRAKAGAARQIGATSGSYEGSGTDIFLEGTYRESLGSAARASLLAVDVPVYKGDRSAVYTISRRVFLPSYREVAGAGADGVYTQAFPNAAARVVQNESAVNSAWFTRTAWADQTANPNYFYYFNASGSGMAGAPSASFFMRPCIALPATQRIDAAPNADGSYTLNNAKTTVAFSFDYQFGDMERRPKQVTVAAKSYENPGTLLLFQLCNNMGDAPEARVWEDAQMGAPHTFANAGKTAAEWAVGVRMQISIDPGQGDGGAVGEFVAAVRV